MEIDKSSRVTYNGIDRAHHASGAENGALRTKVGPFFFDLSGGAEPLPYMMGGDNPVQPLKTPRDYAGQIERLIDRHGLVIEDWEAAEEILKTVHYYRLSVYGIGLKQATDKEKFVSGVSLEHLYRLYTFDGHLRNQLMLTIEFLEIELRTKIAYDLAMQYGAEGYRDPNHFKPTRNRGGTLIHQVAMNRLDNEVRKQSTLPFVKHHLVKYGGHFPIWVAIELFSFGMLSSLYSIMLPQDQKAIAAQYRTNAKYLNGWIQCLVEVRNICAHYGRLYNMPLKKTPHLYTEHAQYRTAVNRIFAVLITIRRMLRGKAVWTTFYTSLVGLMENYPEVRLPFIGFPEEWQSVLAPEEP